MKATTIKLEGRLLRDLEAIKPGDKSLTAYVRDVLEKDVRANRVAEGAAQYAAFLKENRQEAQWLAEWDRADLAQPPKGRAS